MKIDTQTMTDEELAEELQKANIVRDDVVELSRAITGEQKNRAATAKIAEELAKMTPEQRAAVKAAL